MWLTWAAHHADGSRRVHRLAVAYGEGGCVWLGGGAQAWQLDAEGQWRGTVAAAAASTAGGQGRLGDGRLVAPMAGRILQVASGGATLAAGATVVVMEAMKMEHRLVAPAAAVVAQVRVGAGDQVSARQLLVVLGPPPAA